MVNWKLFFKRMTTAMLASAMVLNSTGVMTFAQTINVEKSVQETQSSTEVAQEDIQSQITQTGELQTEGSTKDTDVQSENSSQATISQNVDVTQTYGQSVNTNEQTDGQSVTDSSTQTELTTADINNEVETVEPASDSEETNSVTASLKKQYSQGTDVKGTADESGTYYQYSVKKGQNVIVYTDSIEDDEYNIYLGSDFEYAIYRADGSFFDFNNEPGEYVNTKKGFFNVITAKKDGYVKVSKDIGSKVTCRLTTSPALDYTSMEYGQSYEIKKTNNDAIIIPYHAAYGASLPIEFETAYDSDGLCYGGTYSGTIMSGALLLGRTAKVIKTLAFPTGISGNSMEINYPYEYKSLFTIGKSQYKAYDSVKLEKNKNYKIERLVDNTAYVSANITTGNPEARVDYRYCNKNDTGVGKDLYGYKENEIAFPSYNYESFISTYDDDIEVTMPGGYMPWYKITEVSEPIFKTFSLSKGESLKITAGRENTLEDGMLKICFPYNGKVTGSYVYMKPSSDMSSKTYINSISYGWITMLTGWETYLECTSDENLDFAIPLECYNDKRFTLNKTSVTCEEAVKYEKTMTLSVTEVFAAQKGSTPYESTRSLSAYDLDFYNETTKEYINGYKYSGSKVAFSNGAVKDGDVISAKISGSSIEDYNYKFTYKDNDTVKVKVTEKGGLITTNFNAGNTGRYRGLYLIDKDGKVSKHSYYEIPSLYYLDKGVNKVLLLQSADRYINDIQSLDDLKTLGLVNGVDYVIKDYTVETGVLTPISNDDFIFVTEDKNLTSYVKKQTGVSADTKSIKGDGKAEITVKYNTKDIFKDWNTSSVKFSIPYGLKLTDDGIKVNGKKTDNYIQKSNTYIISTDGTEGTITFSVQLTDTSYGNAQYKLQVIGTLEREDVSYDNSIGEIIFNEPVKQVSYTANISRVLINKGGTATISASVTNGTGNYTYKFISYNPATKQWTKLQDYSTKSSYTWTAKSAGIMQFYVDIKDSEGNVHRTNMVSVKAADEEPAKALSVKVSTSDISNVKQGTKCTFNAAASDGTGKGYTYKFIVYNKTTNQWAKLQDFSSKSSFTWTAGAAGDRYFYVDVKDSSGKTVRSEAVNINTASSKPAVSVTTSTTNVNVGGKVTLTAKGNSGTGSYTYKFIIYNPATNQWAKLQDFSAKNTFIWTAGSAGNRQFYVDIKDSKGNVTRSKVVNVAVGKAQTITKLSVKATASTTSNKTGGNVTFTAAGNGGAGGYTYKFLVYNKTTNQWAKLHDFSSLSKLTWKAGSAGERQFYVDVKDAKGTVVRSAVMNVIK